jgi:hypothetical protein
MRSRAGLRVSVWLLALCAARVAAARDADIGALRAWDLPAYTLIAADGSDPLHLVQRLDNTQRAVSKLLATPVKPAAVPTFVWLVPRKVWNRYLAPSNAIVGEFVPGRFAHYLLIDAGIGGDGVRAGVQHEYAHHFLRTQWGGLYPLWFDEGVAEIMGGARIYANRAVFEVPRTATVRNWIGMWRLFELDKNSREYLSPGWSVAVHGESWAIVHRALMHDTKFANQMFAYLAAVNRLVPSDEAVAQSFGMSFPELDASMKSYVKEGVFAVGAVHFEEAPEAPLPAGRALAPVEALEALARVMLDTGFNPGHVAELVDTAERIAPGSPDVGILRVRLAVRDRKDSEALRLAAALGASNDLATLRDTGLALFERVREPVADDPLTDGLRADFENTAFGLLDRALRIDAGDARSAWGYALLAVRRRDGVDSALERLAVARTRMPGHPDLAEATAWALEARGQEEAMMPFLLDAVRNTSSAAQRARAAQRIADLRIKEREKAPQ